MKRAGVVLILILALFGIVDSAYLLQHELSGAPLSCDIQNFSGCNIVASSPYSRIFDIPLAAFGVLFYGVIFVLAALELAVFDRLLRRALQVISLVGILSSLYFTFIQVFVINALCIYCVISALIALLIFILAGLIEPIGIRPRHPPPDAPPHLTMPPAV
ncbi:MAG: vitamin K epoxide reductase family protein [Candidatus Liptonbacteria bacterium]|nr:vitamin K epoxide reductase family protein [Candidatus Liptonbacteria bacterium]